MSNYINKPFFNVKAFGATGNGSTDDTTAIQNTINACNTAGGGVVYLPAATYKTTASLKLYSGVSPSIVAYQNVTLMGAGSNSTTGTIINFQPTTFFYAFTITSHSASLGATYTNNSITFTVVGAVTSSTTVIMSGSGAPTASGTLTYVSGAITGNITYSAFINITDGIQAWNDVANTAQGLNCSIMDLCVTYGNATKTTSGNGINLFQQAAGGPSFQGWNFENVVVQNFQGSGNYGFAFYSMIMSTIDTCMAVSCANGFGVIGNRLGSFNSVSTSITFQNCYANMATNGVNGFTDIDNTYMSYIGCAVDIGANSAGSSYSLQGSSAVSYYACGTELDGTHTLTNGWNIAADASSNQCSGVGIYDCYMFQSKTCIDINVSGASTNVHVQGFQDNSSVSGSTGLKIAASSVVTISDVGWGAVATQLNNSGTLTILNDGTGKMTVPGIATLAGGINTVTAAAASTPTFVSGTAQQLSTTQDCILYIDVTTAASLTIAIGPTSTPATTIQSAVIGGVGLETVYVPASWYVKLTGTMADLVFTKLIV